MAQNCLSVSGPTKTALTDATSHRRTIYTLTNSSTIPHSALIQHVKDCLTHVPSAFNSQTTRITVLLGDNHTKLWDIVSKALLAKIGEERYNSGTGKRIEGFRAAHGSILFWDDIQGTDGLKGTGGDLYSDKAQEWTHQSNGMHQYYLWTLLESYPDMGVNLQHYNPLIDDEVKTTWGLPSHYVLKAQMVFGRVAEGTFPKERVARRPVEERMGVFGADS